MARPRACRGDAAATAFVTTCAPVALALVFTWGAGDWSLWRHDTAACLASQRPACAHDSVVAAVQFLLDTDVKFIDAHGASAAVSPGELSAYEAFAKLWCPHRLANPVVPYAGTAFGTRLLYFAAMHSTLSHHVGAVCALVLRPQIG